MNPWIRKNRLGDLILKASVAVLSTAVMFLMAAVFA